MLLTYKSPALNLC